MQTTIAAGCFSTKQEINLQLLDALAPCGKDLYSSCGGKMRRAVTKLAILCLGICLLQGAFLKADSKIVKIGEAVIAKDHSDHPQLRIHYTANGTGSSGGAGTWQLMLLAPNGKLFKDHQNGSISLQFPPVQPLTFTIHEHLKQGNYTILAYVLSRTNNIPVNLTTLVSNLIVHPENGKDLFSAQTSFMQGNPSSTVSKDSAQISYSLIVP